MQVDTQPSSSIDKPITKEIQSFYDEYTTIRNLEVPSESLIPIKSEDAKFQCFKDLMDSKIDQRQKSFLFAKRAVDKNLFNLAAIRDAVGAQRKRKEVTELYNGLR